MLFHSMAPEGFSNFVSSFLKKLGCRMAGYFYLFTNKLHQNLAGVAS